MKKLQLQFVFCLLISLLITGNAFSANEFFRSIASGNWNAISTWQMSTNSGSTWIAATLTPTDASGEITVRSPDSVTVTVNVNADQLTVNGGGLLYISTGVTLTLKDGVSTDFTLLTSGSVKGQGTFQTQGLGVNMNIRGGSFFNVNMKVNTGVTTCADQSAPYVAKLYNNITVDPGASLHTGVSSSFDLDIYGSIVNNGTISGANSELVLRGPALTNNSSITSNFRLDSVSNITGAGTFTGTTMIIDSNADITLLSNITISPSSSFTINTNGILDLNSFTFTITSGTFVASDGSSVLNSGIFRTQGTVTMNIRGGSIFSAPLQINTGTTTLIDQNSPYIARIYGSLTIENGATLFCGASLSFSLEAFGAVINNGTISGTNSDFVLKGPSLVNSNSISCDMRMDSVSVISGAGSFTGSVMSIGASGNISCLSNITFSPINSFTLNTGGTLNPNTRNVTFSNGTIAFLTGSTVTGSGLVQTQGNVTLNLRSGSAFNAPLKVLSGITNATEFSTPYKGKLFGALTIDAGASVAVGTSNSYSLEVYGIVTNNGTVSGFGEFILSGTALVNNNSISTYYLRFNSSINLSGGGSFTSTDIVIDINDTVKILSNITINPVTIFSIRSGGVLNPNTFVFTVIRGEFEVLAGGTVFNSGSFRTEGTVSLDLRSGSAFNSPLNIISGITTVADISSPYKARLYGPVTIDNGASLKIGYSLSYSLEVYGNVTNNGSITSSTGAELIFTSGAHTFQGTGFCVPNMVVLTGGILNVTSSHNLSSVNINTGSTMNISNQTIGFSLTNPITQNGTFTTTNSKIEYNGSSLQNISTSNIIYSGLRINNPAGTSFLGNVTVNDTFSVIQGDVNLNGKTITLASTGYLTETPGNVLYGTAGFITYTRNIGIPTALNAGGLGAILTATSNLGVTEINRGHTVQSGLNGGTSIKRYYDITPANNSGLNANLVFKYDDTELNGKPDTLLKLFKSTNSGSTWQYMIGSVNINTNEITLNGITSFSRWSSDSSNASASIKMVMGGFYNPVTNRLNMDDTVRVYLRNNLFPYAVVDSAKAVVNSFTFGAEFQFANASSGTYYLQIKHRNTIETWSNAGIIYNVGTALNYDFTIALSQAFGSNQSQVDATPLRFGMYGGDVNQDGVVDAGDLSAVDNDAAESLSGYVSTDVNGDDFVDAGDVSIVDNNAALSVSVIAP